MPVELAIIKKPATILITTQFLLLPAMNKPCLCALVRYANIPPFRDSIL